MIDEGLIKQAAQQRQQQVKNVARQTVEQIPGPTARGKQQIPHTPEQLTAARAIYDQRNAAAQAAKQRASQPGTQEYLAATAEQQYQARQKKN